MAPGIQSPDAAIVNPLDDPSIPHSAFAPLLSPAHPAQPSRDTGRVRLRADTGHQQIPFQRLVGSSSTLGTHQPPTSAQLGQHFEFALLLPTVLDRLNTVGRPSPHGPADRVRAAHNVLVKL